jgi:hypothetical protein
MHAQFGVDVGKGACARRPGDFPQPGSYEPVIYAVTRFGPYRFDEFSYVRAKKRFKIA